MILDAHRDVRRDVGGGFRGGIRKGFRGFSKGLAGARKWGGTLSPIHTQWFAHRFNAK